MINELVKIHLFVAAVAIIIYIVTGDSTGLSIGLALSFVSGMLLIIKNNANQIN